MITPRERELSLAQRYYAKTFPLDVTPASNTGSHHGAILTLSVSGNVYEKWHFPVRMRRAPTVATYKVDGAGGNWTTNCAVTPTAGVSNPSDLSVLINGVGGSNGCGYYIHITADAEL